MKIQLKKHLRVGLKRRVYLLDVEILRPDC